MASSDSCHADLVHFFLDVKEDLLTQSLHSTGIAINVEIQ